MATEEKSEIGGRKNRMESFNQKEHTVEKRRLSFEKGEKKEKNE